LELLKDAMINHARTLLINKPRSRMHYSDYGYEYVPKSFKPVALTPTLMTLHKILFGVTPDNYFINFRADEILSYIHSTELAEYVYKLDRRVTYWPKVGRPYFEPARKRVLITQIYGNPLRLTVAGSFNALTSVGRSFNLYTVSLHRVSQGDATALEFTVTQRSQNQSITQPIPDANSPPAVPLPNSQLNVRLNTNPYQTAYNNILTEIEEFMVIEAYDTENAEKLAKEQLRLASVNATGLEAQWLIETKANPQPIITTALPAIELLGEPAFLELFGLEDKEPYLTFKNLWFDHPLPAYRLSGIVLALIYRTNELRG